jgi:hypothetical protein
VKPIPVKFHCIMCEDRNKSLLGEPGFETFQSDFELLTDATFHVNMGHVVEAYVDIRDVIVEVVEELRRVVR